MYTYNADWLHMYIKFSNLNPSGQDFCIRKPVSVVVISP